MLSLLPKSYFCNAISKAVLPNFRNCSKTSTGASKDKKEAKSAPPATPAKTENKGDQRKIFKVYRFQGVETKMQPTVQSFELDVSKCGKMVLDALIMLKDMDPTLSFRRSCREGICGSCAINLQGVNCLACTTQIPKSRTIKIYPLPHMYVLRDLVTDLTHFYKGYNSIMPYIIRSNAPPLGFGQYAQSIKDNTKLEGLYECILCACCSTSCPSYWWNGRRFLGPASLLHAYRWVIDSRDGHTYARLNELRDDFKVFRCHTIMNCSVVCPKGLNPAVAIAKLKRLISGLEKVPRPELDPLKFAGGDDGGESKKDSCSRR